MLGKGFKLFVIGFGFLFTVGAIGFSNDALNTEIYDLDSLICQVNLRGREIDSTDFALIAEVLLKYGNNPPGWPAINYAAFSEDEEAVRLLIEYGADVNSFSEGGSVLDLIISQNNLSLLQFIVDRGCLVEKNFVSKCLLKDFFDGIYWYFEKEYEMPDNSGEILRSLFIDKPSRLIQCFIFNGANCQFLGLAILAVKRGDVELVRDLIEHRMPINFNLQEDLNENPLVIAASLNMMGMAKLLKDAGALISDPTSNMLFEIVCTDHNTPLMELLIDMDFPIDNVITTSRYKDSTPLQIAIAEKDTELAELLLRKGADVEMRGNLNITPLKQAVAVGHKEIVELLIQHGAKVRDL